MLSVGIVGLPNAGKSTLFNALMSRQMAAVADYPFTTIEPNTGVVEVPDERLVKLAETLKIEKVVPATVKFIDIAGLVKGAAKGEGLGNKFLSHIREVEAIVQVVREFSNKKVVSQTEKILPIEDMETINLELILADWETVTRALEKEKETAKKEILLNVQKILGEGKRAAELTLLPSDEEEIKTLNLLTIKPMIYVINTDEALLSGRKKEEFSPVVREADKVIFLSAKLENELQELTEEERGEYLKGLGLSGCCLDRLIKAAYQTLGLISFFTVAGGKQAQSWSIKEGATALEAAGAVHTDMAKGFIKAEVIGWEELVSLGSWQEAVEKGRVRTVGRDYGVNNGEVVEFKFNPPSRKS